MIIEYSLKEIQAAVMFHYRSHNNCDPREIDTVSIGKGDNGYICARLKVQEETKAKKMEITT